MYRPNYFVEGGNMAMNNKKPAMLQAFYKLVYATEPAILSGKDVVYIFKNDDSILKSFFNTFQNVVSNYENAKFCLSADLQNGSFVLYVKDLINGPYIQFDIVTEEELFLIQSLKERHYF